jgi:NAD(P)-dependent dehydrogenase (short-subunit alcohol dehydrogenase family)
LHGPQTKWLGGTSIVKKEKMGMKLEGMVALVSGGGTGIGRAVAILFAQEGARVVVTGRTQKTLEETVSLVTERGGEAMAVRGDATLARDAELVVEKTVNRYGSMDILCNNAGARYTGKVTETSEETYNDLMATNVKTIFLFCKYAIPHMLDKGKGSIVNISSISGLDGLPNRSVYCASKAAAINFSRAIAADYVSQGIRVNCICPGPVVTPMLNVPQDQMHTFAQSLPMKRIPEPEEVAKAALFFASDDSTSITGDVMVLDGGIMLVSRR